MDNMARYRLMDDPPVRKIPWFLPTALNLRREEQYDSHPKRILSP